MSYDEDDRPGGTLGSLEDSFDDVFGIFAILFFCCIVIFNFIGWCIKSYIDYPIVGNICLIAFLLWIWLR